MLISGDLVSNPGPENPNNHNIYFCHWNLNGIAANSFVKISLLEAYITVHDFDVICISETFLDLNYSSVDQRLNLQGYVIIRSDHPSDTKRGAVCMYYKEHLAFTRRNDITFLDECLVWKIKIKNKKCFVTCFYCSPTEDETNIFLFGFEFIIISNLFHVDKNINKNVHIQIYKYTYINIALD